MTTSSEPSNPNNQRYPSDGASPPWQPAYLESLSFIAFKQAKRILRDTEDAKDFAQAAMAALLARVGRPDNPEAWVSTVARRLALNELRRRKHYVDTLRRLAPQEGRDTNDFTDRVVGRLLLDEILESLPKRQREALEMQFRSDLSQVTVAQAMEIGIETVKTHIERGRKSVRARYEELAEDGGRSDG